MEMLDHIFCTGGIARHVWSAFDLHFGESTPIFTVRHMVLTWLLRLVPNLFLAFVYRILTSLICWELWKERICVVFDGILLG